MGLEAHLTLLQRRVVLMPSPPLVPPPLVIPLQAAFMVMGHLGGKLLLFQSSVPSLGVAKVKNRENLTLYGTEREHSLRNPEVRAHLGQAEVRCCTA